MAQLRLSVSWNIQLSRNIRAFADNLKNMKEFYQEAVDIIAERKDAVFSEEGSNVKKWPKRKALSPVTLEARASRKWHYSKSPSKPWILRRTWRLQEDVTIVATDSMGSIKMNAPYAAQHQNWSWKIPKRPMLDIDNETGTKIVKALQEKIHNDLNLFWLQA